MLPSLASACKHRVISHCFALQRLPVVLAEASGTCWHFVTQSVKSAGDTQHINNLGLGEHSGKPKFAKEFNASAFATFREHVFQQYKRHPEGRVTRDLPHSQRRYMGPSARSVVCLDLSEDVINWAEECLTKSKHVMIGSSAISVARRVNMERKHCNE